MTMVVTDAPLRSEASEARVTLAQWAWTFVPFGLGLVAAMLLAELTQDLRLFRTVYAVRVSMLLAIPALVLFPFRDRSPAVKNYWRLFWTFSLLAYAVHFAYAWFGVFGGQVETSRLHPELFHVAQGATPFDLIRAHQGDLIAFSNLVLTGLWLLDVALAWLARGSRGFVAFFHALTWLYVLVSFAVASVLFYKNMTSYAIGWVMVAATALALIVRAFSRGPAPSPSSPS